MYIKYTIDNINLDEVDNTLNAYITIHNEKFNFYLISCKLIIEFDNNFTENIENNYFYKTDIINIYRNLLYTFYNFIPRIYKPSDICNIKHMILKTINDRCNMTYKYYKNTPMSMIEKELILILLKIPN